jgi:hypothetical protein
MRPLHSVSQFGCMVGCGSGAAEARRMGDSCVRKDAQEGIDAVGEQQRFSRRDRRILGRRTGWTRRIDRNCLHRHPCHAGDPQANKRNKALVHNILSYLVARTGAAVRDRTGAHSWRTRTAILNASSRGPAADQEKAGHATAAPKSRLPPIRLFSVLTTPHVSPYACDGRASYPMSPLRCRDHRSKNTWRPRGAAPLQNGSGWGSTGPGGAGNCEGK